MSIQLKDLLNAEVKKKLENLEKNPKAKLPKQKKAKKQILKEDKEDEGEKGNNLAARVIATYKKALNSKDRDGKDIYSDDDVFAFRERIAFAIDAVLK